MAANYSMFKCYKGEKENPFDEDKQNAQYQFWFYESVFNDLFEKYESSDWFSFFDMHENMGSDFMKLLSDPDYVRPTEEKKKPIFELWLTYLFKYKLYPEFGGENTYKKLYDAIDQ